MSYNYTLQPPVFTSAASETFNLPYAPAPYYSVVCKGTLDISPLSPDQKAFIIANINAPTGSPIVQTFTPQPVGDDGTWQFSVPVDSPVPQGSQVWAVAWLVSPDGQTLGSSNNGMTNIQ